jgi:hypothetical protein
METKIKKVVNQKMVIDLSLNKLRDRDLFPEKTKKFNEMVNRIGEDNFVKLTGAKKRI